MLADGRAPKVQAALERLSLPLEHHIGSSGASLEPALACLRLLHAPEEQLDAISAVEVHIHKEAG